VTARKIRMTAVGLVAMPASYDEAKMTADDLANDAALCTAFAELHGLFEQVEAKTEDGARDAGTYEAADRFSEGRDRVEASWDVAIDLAVENDVEGIRRALREAHDQAKARGFDTTHEDAALAMLPPVVPS
jgi:hypothetical protein